MTPAALRVDADDRAVVLSYTIRDAALRWVARARTGEPFPLAPGTYMIEMALPGRSPLRTAVTLGDDGTTVVTVPAADTGRRPVGPLLQPSVTGGPFTSRTTDDGDVVVLNPDRGTVVVSLRPHTPSRDARGGATYEWHVPVVATVSPVRVEWRRRRVVPDVVNAPWFTATVEFAEQGDLVEACEVLETYALRHPAPQPLALLGLLAVKVGDERRTTIAHTEARRRLPSADLLAMAAAAVGRFGDPTAAGALADAALETGSPCLSLGVAAVVALSGERPDARGRAAAARRLALTLLLRHAVMSRVLLHVVGGPDDLELLRVAYDQPAEARPQELLRPPPSEPRTVTLRLDRSGALAAGGAAGDGAGADPADVPAVTTAQLTRDLAIRVDASSRASEIIISAQATDPGWSGTLITLTVTETEVGPTPYLLALVGDGPRATGRLIVVARSADPTVSIATVPRPPESLGDDDAAAVRRSIGGTSESGVEFWLGVARRRRADDAVASVIREELD
jgi:xanthosine utilization system XapX-like protein